MQLTAAQLREMDERGFLTFPSLFNAEEMAVVNGAVPGVLAHQGPEVIGEDDDPTIIKMIFALHEFDDVFGRISRHPRLVKPAEQILGDQTHLFQSRFNVKLAFRASGWPWHQDFNQWYRHDGMRTPRALIAGVFLDDVNPCNGPLMVIPGSHKRGHYFNRDSMEVAEEVVAAAAEEGGIVPLMGPPGTVVLFDCLIIHGSPANISPWPRRIYYMNFTPVSNHELQPLRAAYHCDTNVRAVLPLADDCLLPAGRSSHPLPPGLGGAPRPGAAA